jgi:hypothetical protein
MRPLAARWLFVVPAMLLAACTINIGTGERPTPSPSRASVGPTPTPSPSLTVTQAIGSGNVITETRQVSGFNRIRFRGSGSLIVEQTGVESLTVEAEDNIVPLLRSDVENRVLILGLRPGTSIVAYKPIVFRLTVRELTGIEVSGSGATEVNRLDTARFDFDGSGSGEARLSGRAEVQEVSLSGSGEYDAESLISRAANVRVSGSAEVVINASDSLDVDVSGSADVRYVGSPRLSQRVSGSGSVTSK